MRRLARILTCLCLPLAACSPPVTRDLVCPGLDPAEAGLRGAVDGRRAGPSLTGNPAGASLADSFASFFTGARLRNARTEPLRVLALSTGGQWGAFGSGFLTGWSRNTAYRRPQFDLVTGASAGGVIAPAAFAGLDDALPFGGDVDDYALQRPLLSLLSSNSVYDVRNLEAEVDRANTDRLRKAIADGARAGRKLVIGAVNLDTTRFEAYDITAYAASGQMRRACLSEAVLSTAAIPVLLPPRRFNGALHADAGLREHIFLRELSAARDRAGSSRPVEVFVIVNGDLRPPTGEGKLSEGIVDLSQRAFGIVTDQGMRDSIRNVLDFAGKRGWTVRGMTANSLKVPGHCAARQKDKALFNSCITQYLFAAGRRIGENHTQSTWLSETELRDLLRKL